jgi:3-dehydro-L-gulonate 2-dehydrogenase
MVIASENGMGLVALANTNHWMRGGTYGWYAAKKGFIFIGWTNTEANMPAWGAKEARLGNNPLIFAVPFENEAIVLDFAMTQFSYGKMENYKLAGERLPFPGGYNSRGELTDDPTGILETRRTLPVGYWKGAGLSLMLDILSTILTGGRSVSEITKHGNEHGLSQVFIAINPASLSNYKVINDSVRMILKDYKESLPSDGKSSVRYPGENILKLREENSRNGIPVMRKVWESIIDL